MFERKIEQELMNWKNSLKYKKKAFILKGLRQVGKTVIIKKFASENFDNTIYINFKEEINIKKAFDSNLLVDEIITNLSILKPGISFIPFKTVLLFDEIQECSGARASIKPFMEDGRFDIIASGSLLGIKGYNQNYQGGVSVGFEHTVYMKPMDFEEFLWAKGISKDTLSYLKDCLVHNKPIRIPIHETMLRYFKEYMCVGGMPSIVNTFVKTKDYNAVLVEQKDILEGYKDDFAKHLNENEEEKVDLNLLTKINRIYDSIPSQLAKENKKFTYSTIEKKGTSLKYGSAIQWLVDYGLVNYCYNLSTLSFPLEGNKIDNIFKLYFSDSGLFISMLDRNSANDIMFGDMGLYKGYIYENIIADALSKMSIPLYYFSKESGLEIDFISRHENDIILIEVKAKNGNSKSAKTVLNDKISYPHVSKVIKLSSNNIGENNNILTIPYYMICFLKDYLN